MQQLTGQDAMFLHAEMDGFPMHIGGISIYDQSTAVGGRVRFKDILATFARRVHRSPIFRRKLKRVPMGLDQPYWVDDARFDLEYHIRHIALPRPGDWRQLLIQVARLHAQPLDMKRPLWQIYVIEGLNNIDGVPPGSFALYTKVHHAAMDGATGVQFFGAFNDMEPNPVEEESPDWVVQPEPGNTRLLGRAYLNNLRKPWQIVQLARQALPARKRLKQGKEEDLFQSLEDKEPTRFNRDLSPHRVVEARKFDFEEVREIKSAVPGATINDAVLTIISGAMRSYLESKGELPENSMVAGCPIDVRDESEQEAGGNMIGLMNVALRSDIADPMQRLQAVHEQANRSKAYAEAMGPRIGLDIADTVPGGIISSVMRLSVAAGMTEKNVMQHTIVTNVPGSPFQLYLCGAELVDSFGIGVLAPGMGLFHTVTSAVMNKKGSIIIAALSCREVMPDPEFYAECLQASFAELLQASREPRGKKSA
ncbi:MAG: wax ester/triacylglycerol synthase family O-acyltransferase [Halieaceae bacterium]